MRLATRFSIYQVGAFVFFPLVFFASTVVADSFGIKRVAVVPGIAAFATLLLFSLTPSILLVVYLLRLRARVRRAHGYLCVWCGHDLSAVSGISRCPECGKEVEWHKLRGEWASFVGNDVLYGKRPR